MRENDFVWHDFDDKSKNKLTFASDYTFYFNKEVKEIVMAKKLTHLRVWENKCTGTIRFVFNRELGMEIHFLSSLTIRNSKCVKWLRYMTGAEKTLTLSDDQANTNDFATFEIIKEKKDGKE